MTFPVRRTRYTTIVVALLAAVFTGIGAVLAMLGQTTFRPLPFSRPETLFQFTAGGNLWEPDTLAHTMRLTDVVTSYATYEPASPWPVSWRGTTATAAAVATSSNFVDLLGLRVTHANLYATEVAPVVISRGLALRLGLSPASAAGETIRVGERSRTVIAVIDQSNAFPVDADLWYPDPRRRGPVWVGIARVRTGTDADALATRLTRAMQTVAGGDQRLRTTAIPLSTAARPAMPAEQRALSAGILVFAVIAILNFGLLGLGNARRRSQEYAIRIALGASREQVARGVFTGQLLLIGIALVVAAVILAAVAILSRGALATMLPNGLPEEIWMAIVAFAALLVVAALLPSRIASASGEMEVLRRVRARGSRFEPLWNRAFVGTQFAVTACLIVSGGIAATMYYESGRTKYGFDASGSIAGIQFKGPALQEETAALQAALSIAAELERTMPGRATVFGQTFRTMEGGRFKFATDPETPGGDRIVPSATASGRVRPPWMSQDVMPDFFGVMGIPIVAGRGFRATDVAGSEPVVILSERAARQFGKPADALGTRLRFGQDDGDWRTIVGIAADAYPIETLSFLKASIGVDPRRRWPTAVAYRPLAQVGAHAASFKIVDGRAVSPEPGMFIIARAPVSILAGAITPLLGRFAPGEKARELKRLDEYLDGRGETRRAQVTARLLAEFACGGFALAVLGALLLIDEVVRSRTNEIGIRRALGAPARSVVLLASRETFVAAVVGVVAGTFAGARFGPVVAVWMTGSISSRFLPVTHASPSIIAVTALGLALLTAAATALRATRAARLDPAIALRIE